MTAPRWSRNMLPPQEPMFAFTPMSISGPIGGLAQSDVIEGDIGFWRVSFGSVVVNNPQRVQTWNAYSALFNGRAGTMLVPFCRAHQPTLSIDGAYDPVEHDDDSLFDDDTGYGGGTVDVRLATDAADRAASLLVDVRSLGEAQPGHKFSIGERLYEIRSILFSSTTRATMKIRPNLRGPAKAGTELDFDDPVVRVRLASDIGMDLKLQMHKAMPSVDFVEDLRR